MWGDSMQGQDGDHMGTAWEDKYVYTHASTCIHTGACMYLTVCHIIYMYMHTQHVNMYTYTQMWLCK